MMLKDEALIRLTSTKLNGIVEVLKRVQSECDGHPEDAGTGVQVDVGSLIDINQQIAALLHTLVDVTLSEAGELLPSPGPHLKNLQLSRAIKAVVKKFVVRTYKDLARLTKSQVLQCKNIDMGGYEVLRKLLETKGLSFAEPPQGME